MDHLEFTFRDRREERRGVDSVTVGDDDERPLRWDDGGNQANNPFRNLPTVQELRERIRDRDTEGEGPSAPPGGGRAMSRGRKGEKNNGGAGEIVIGVDVARFGSDSTAICVRKGRRVVHLAAYEKEDTMQTAGRVAAAIRKYGPDSVFIDEIGIGAGVIDRLKELKFRNIYGVNVAKRAADPKSYANVRAELFGKLRKRFEERTIKIPRDQELVEQLSAIRYSFTSSGQMQIESKESMSSRGLKSPDKADAVALAFCFRRVPLRARL